MKYRPLKLAICISMLAVPQFAMAQSSFTKMEVDRLGQTNVQARLSFTMPFGGQTSDLKTKSKLSLGFRTETPSSAFHSSSHTDWMMRAPEIREVKLGLTLEKSPQFLMNDNVLFTPEALQANDTKTAKGGTLDSYDKTILTVIGVSLVVIAGSIIIIAD